MPMNKSLQHYQNLVEQVLNAWLPLETEMPQRLHQAMRYSTLAGGKRLRPAWTLATAEMLGGSLDDALVPAAAIELIHVYSLIHDDLPAMDDDDWRRGQPTCHRAFDEAIAILAGDALQTLAFEWIASKPMANVSAERRLSMIKILAHAAGTYGMGGGQAIDLESSGQTLTEDQLAHLHQLKTGALIRASIQLGILCAPPIPHKASECLDKYASCLGLAFQIQDDILDVIGDSERLGKTPGTDQKLQKTTYVDLLGLEGAKAKAAQLTDEALQALAQLPYNTDTLAHFAELVVTRDH